MTKTIVNSDQSLADYIEYVRHQYLKHRYIQVSVSKATRTILQNSSMHKYFALLSNELNDRGLDIRQTLREDFEIPWTPPSCKELIWKPVQRVLYNKESTTKLERAEVSGVYDVINRHMMTKDIYVPFPNKENFNQC